MFGGSSPPALEFAARHCDTWLSLALPPSQIADKVDQVRRLAAANGRTMRYGLRLHVIVRETEKEAWAQAQWLYDRMDQSAIQRRLAQEQRSDGVGGAMMRDLVRIYGSEQPKDARAFEIYPSLWSAIGLIRNGPGTTIVGDPDTVVETLRSYERAGIEVFILGGWPHIEESYRFADLVMPRLTGVARQAKVAWV
jgi:alkanesulfonate monooxygenase